MSYDYDILYETTSGVWIGTDRQPQHAKRIIDLSLNRSLGGNIYIRAENGVEVKLDQLPADVMRAMRNALTRMLVEFADDGNDRAILAVQEVR